MVAVSSLHFTLNCNIGLGFSTNFLSYSVLYSREYVAISVKYFNSRIGLQNWIMTHMVASYLKCTCNRCLQDTSARNISKTLRVVFDIRKWLSCSCLTHCYRESWRHLNLTCSKGRFSLQGPVRLEPYLDHCTTRVKSWS